MLRLSLGLGLGASPAVTGGGGGGGGFNWTGYEAPFDASLTSTLFQDTAGSTVVTTDGQNVACIKHPVGGATLWTAPDTTDCFVYVANSGTPYIRPKTTAAFLAFTAASSNVLHVLMKLRVPTDTDNGRIMAPNYATGAGDSTPYLSNKTGRLVEFYNNGVMTTTTSPTSTTDFLIEALTTASGGTTPAWGALYYNSVSEGGLGSSLVPGAAAITNGVRLGTGGSFGGSTMTDLRFYKGVISRTQLSDSTLTNLRTYLAS